MDNQLKEQMLDLLMGSLTNEAKKFATEEIDKIKKGLENDLSEMKTNATKLKEEIDKVLADCPTVVNLGDIEKPKKEMTHSCFDKVLKVMASAKRKEKNIMLVGGAGGGKTHLVKQIADVLKLPFYPMSVGMQTTKSDLLGFINATGQYMPSCIRQAYENGGVLLLDEFDAAHAGVVTVLNSLLANGHCSFPDKVIDKHKDFHCLVACNTYGTGANLDYIGRNRLDGATLDRFIIIDMDYDSKLEKRLTKNNWWYGVVNKIRKNAASCGIKVIISPRACMDGADLLDAGFEPSEVVDMTIIKGCSEDIKKKLLNGVRLVMPDDKEEDAGEDENNGHEFLYDVKIYLDENNYSYVHTDWNRGGGEHVIHACNFDGEKYEVRFGHFINDGVQNKERSLMKLTADQTKGDSTYAINRNGYSAHDLDDVLSSMNGFNMEANFDGNVRFRVYQNIFDETPKQYLFTPERIDNAEG